MFYHWRTICCGGLLTAMKKSEEPYMVIDGEDAFPDFANPEWVKRMLAKAEKRAAQRPKSKANERGEATKHPSTSGVQHP